MNICKKKRTLVRFYIRKIFVKKFTISNYLYLCNPFINL
jgi:hypothetical protein